MSISTKGCRFLSQAIPAAAGAVALAVFTLAAPGEAQAVECLLDTNNNGIADGADTDGGAQGTGVDSLACGLDAIASDAGATALGTDAEATDDETTAVGSNAAATEIGATALGAGSTASGLESVAVGFAARAIGDLSTAAGFAALATDENAVAYGAVASALSPDAVSIGFASVVAESSPGGSRGGIALGASAMVGLDPTGPDVIDSAGAIAIGSSLDDDGIGAVALFDGATALGADAQALAPGSTALGARAVAGLPNEFVMGTIENTYTAPGITSQQSRARQFGRLELLTTDRFGHLASDGGIVFDKLAEVQAGVALGLAMEAPDLAPAERFALRAGYGNFEGDSHAFGITMIGSLLEDHRRWTWDAGFGAGWSDFAGFESGASWGGRAGVQVAW